jgi:hypothetical protein
MGKLREKESIKCKKMENVKCIDTTIYAYKIKLCTLLLITAHQCGYFLEIIMLFTKIEKIKQNKLRGLSPRANYTDRATAACRRS